MASPRLETFCCSNRDTSTDFIVSFQDHFFSAICIGSGSVSLIFSVLQILPKRKGYRHLGQHPLSKPASSPRILLIISLCDILGCADVDPAVFSASFWWTFCYAVDVYLVVKRSAGISTIVLYHMITWGLAVMLCVEGVAMLYYPSIYNCENGLQHAIPHYITTYAPLLLVLLVNPVLFTRTVSTVTSLLKSRQGIYTENERRLGMEIKIRFFKIMLVFSVCWLPNVVNEGLLFYLEMQDDIKAGHLKNVRNAALITWFIMGILNPMQSFLNTLAFHGWTGCDVDLRIQRAAEVSWDSTSTSVPGAGAYNAVRGSTMHYESHVQENKKIIISGQQHSDAVTILSEGSDSSTTEVHVSSELRDYEGRDAEGESLEGSVRH